ncbi:SAF domain-containing protein [Actinoplanes sp. G11-F43]|uniref:SAF domain-containing protein n=1 Tax=Actinoplanes sp. G11-F43 TaxID=3424130 RepID=UPI003D34779F
MSSSATLDASRSSGTTGLPVNGSSGPVIRRRVSVHRVLLAALLILGFALAGAVVANRVDTRVPVLAAAHDIAAGQMITEVDLVVVRVAAESGVATLPDAQRLAVAGRTAAIPVAAGTLLHDGLFGELAWPVAGQSVIAVAVKPGRAPAGLTAGSPVTVLIVPVAGAGGGDAAGLGAVVQARATVVSVEQAADQSGQQIVSLLLAGNDATKVASATGEATLIQLGAGR